ncbi:MAG: amino acid ABC transporter substrate-binding protein [Lachnospiraceae bacterium]|nr:amino acid ABC transporter substrate-binding protein [Lachnospiraceae bacterium]
MRKFKAVFAAMAALSLMVTGCSSAAPATADQSAPAKSTESEAPTVSDSSDTFTVGFDADFPPYGYVDENGEYVGFDLDLAAEAASRIGRKVVYQPIDWNSKDMELDSGAIDCIWNGFTMSEERLDAYEWTKPYVDNSQVIVTAADSGIKSLADLSGKILCVQADSSALEALNSEEHQELRSSLAELMQVPEYNTAFMNLESGAVDAIAMDVGVAKYQIQSRNADFVILDQKLVSELYGVGFKKGNTELRDQIQGALDAMAADGTLQKIAEKWEQQDTLVLGNE